MPENEFEKKVSSEMQELKFKPSENVWLRVEERIKKKKKRRVFVIIFLLSGLALLGYWQRSNLFGESENDVAKTEKGKAENSKPAEETKNTSAKQSTKITKKEGTQNTTHKPVNDILKENKLVIEKGDNIVSKNEINKPKKGKNKTKVQPVTEKTKKDNKPEVSITIVSATPKKKGTIIDDGKTKDVPEIRTNPETIVKQEDAKQSEVKPVESEIDSAKAQKTEQEKIVAEKTDTLLKVNEAIAPSTPIVKKDPSEKEWKWGLHITPGISSLSDHGLSFSSQNNTGRFSYVNSPGSSSGIPPIRQKPSDVKPGFAFQAGTFVQRQLSSRTSLSFGLQYGYYSNILHIGNRRDSPLRFNQVANTGANNYVYNAGGDTIKYTNQYHFIELPLSFQWQLNKNKAKPFIWSTGFTIGQLMASNAIMYDTAFNGIYHQNKKLLNKTQFSLSTGFSCTIANTEKLQWSLGPVANIHLNKLVDNPFDNKGYLFFVGLRTGVLFNQKK